MTAPDLHAPPRGPSSAARSRDLTVVVALAAVLWGTDGLLRLPLSGSLPAATVVLLEHLVVVLVLIPFLPSALRALAAAPVATRWSVVGIGAGASATATVLFTAAFTADDPITPLVLQKLQPVVAVLAAAAFLGERVSRRFPLFAVPALVGAWLLAFPDPLHVQVQGLRTAALSLGAAVLWAAGTVLGRAASAHLSALDLVVLRFAVGLPASAVLVALTGARWTPPSGDVPGLVVLALVPGLLALLLYYRGLARTPASRATLAELAFPLTSAVVGVAFLDARLDPGQWVGAAVVAVSVTAMALHEHLARRPCVPVPDDAQRALAA